jgi:hypothetical protein
MNIEYIENMVTKELEIDDCIKRQLVNAGWIEPPKALKRIGKLTRDGRGNWVLFDQSGKVTFNAECEFENFNGLHVWITIEEQRQNK